MKISSIYKGNIYVKPKKKNKKKYKKPYGCSRAVTYKPDQFYDSEAWLQLRYKALVKYGAKCQCCGRTRADNIRIHVDHIKPRSKHPELQLNLDNLQILCHECNIGKSNSDSTDWRDLSKKRV